MRDPVQPYIYAPPSRPQQDPFNNGFDPKPYTRASMVPRAPPKPKPKQEGPLLDFNRHPDSYLMVPYGLTNATPMAPNTKRNVNIARGIQLGLRILEMITSLCMLVLVIIITHTNAAESWIIRIAVSLTKGFFAKSTANIL